MIVTRDQQIRKALEVLRPPAGERAECQHDIEVALDIFEQRAGAARSFRVANSKKGKAGLKRYHAALRRLRNAYQSLDPAIRPWFSLVETAYISGKPTVIDREITISGAFLARPAASPRREASRNKAAAEVASYLLDWWGRKASATRGGEWEKLAKILTADLTVDLFDHLREFKRRGGARIEKLRRAHSLVYRTRR
jgi:outer membrane protein TolC